MLRFATRLRVYAPPAGAASLPAPSAWELTFGIARLTLSPEKHRGFSGEGTLLSGLAGDADADADADLLAALLPWDARLDPARLSVITGLSPERTVVSASRLAASGGVGYDLAEQSFFNRELPFTVTGEDHPRLRDARTLVAEGKVTLTPTGAMIGGGADPDDKGASATGHRVTFASPRDLCTCPWWGKHQGTRGPCKHVLGARMAARAQVAA